MSPSRQEIRRHVRLRLEVKDSNSVLCTPFMLSVKVITKIATSRPNPKNCDPGKLARERRRL